MEIPIIFEDNNFVVFDKPAGLVVNRSETSGGNSLQDYLEKKFIWANTEGNSDFRSRSGIVHRLDKDTSGLIIVAKNPQAFEQLQRQFFLRKVTKKYIALVHGKVAPAQATVKAPIARLPWNRKRFGVLPEGKPAETEYRLLTYYEFQDKLYSLLSVSPLSGRTHQIRVHLKHLGYPVVGDKLYGGKLFSREDAELSARIFLHACYLKFQHPNSAVWLDLESNLPEDLQGVLARMKVIEK